jgi:ketosteroid isomerase-like protein
MSIDYATGADLLEAYRQAWRTFSGDDWVGLFTPDAEYSEDPFEPPLVGHNELRAYLLRAWDVQEQVEFTVERHWVSGSTVLAAWHASYVHRESRHRVRLAGFMTMEVASDGRIHRFREWWHKREHAAE